MTPTDTARQITELPEGALFYLNDVGYQDAETHTDDLKALAREYLALRDAAKNTLNYFTGGEAVNESDFATLAELEEHL